MITQCDICENDRRFSCKVNGDKKREESLLNKEKCEDFSLCVLRLQIINKEKQ